MFSPLDRRVRASAYAAALSPRASALRRAFSRRISWDVQALLWATEVEGIAESDVVHRLGQIHPGREAGLVALRLAYLDLRRDLDVGCRATLRSVFGSSSGPREARCETPIWLRALCVKPRHGGSPTLDRLCAACLPAMPSDVWEEDTTARPGRHSPWGRTTSRHSDGATQPSDATDAPTDALAEKCRGRAVGGRPGEGGRSARPPPLLLHREPALVCRAVEAQKVVDHVVYR